MPVTLTFDLEIQQGSRGRRGTCACNFIKQSAAVPELSTVN